MTDAPLRVSGESRGLPEEPVTFESSDGVALSGILRRIDGTPKAGMILAHGIMTEKDYGGFYPALAAALARHGYESLRFDFRGHGESEGTPGEMTIAGEVRDLAAAVRLLRRRHPPHLGIVGTSFGAGIAVLYAAQVRQRPFALVLLSSVLDYGRTFLVPETPWAKKWFTPSALAKGYASGTLDLGFFALGRGLLREFQTVSPAKVLRQLTIPVLIIHSERDPIAPFQAAQDAARSNPGVKFLRVRGAGHYFEGSRERVLREISSWLDTRVPA